MITPTKDRIVVQKLDIRDSLPKGLILAPETANSLLERELEYRIGKVLSVSEKGTHEVKVGDVVCWRKFTDVHELTHEGVDVAIMFEDNLLGVCSEVEHG